MSELTQQTQSPDTAGSHITDAMRQAIGAEMGRRVSYPIAASDIRKWALAVYYPEEPPRIYWDDEYANKTVHGGIVAPEEFNPFAWLTAEPKGVQQVDRLNPDLTEETLGLPGPGFKFSLNGGLEVDYGARMRPGDVITAVRRLHKYAERAGRLGLMLFTTTEETWTNQDDVVVKRLRYTSIRY